MSWIDDFGRPLCPTREEAESYVTEELIRAAPAGWKVDRIEASGPPDAVPIMSWRVLPARISPGEWPLQEYDIHLTASLEFMIFTHGNTDAGPMSLHHNLQHALVIQAWAVRQYGIAACLNHVMATCEPNRWGAT